MKHVLETTGPPMSLTLTIHRKKKYIYVMHLVVLMTIVDVFCAIAGEGGIAAGRLQLFVEQGILTGKIILPVGIHRDHDAGGALHKVVTA